MSPNTDKNKKAVVLLSAGLDSTVNLFLAHKHGTVSQTVTFNYGQKAAVKELDRAQKLSAYFKIPNQVIDLPWLKHVGQSSLTSDRHQVPTGNQVAITDFVTSTQTAKSVWVPNRNGVFLNIAAALAEAMQADYVVPGFNVEEAATFPDNSEDFMTAATSAFKFSTANQIQVMSYTVKMNKTEIVQAALSEKVPLKMIWPCYFNGEKWCGQCESCLRTKRAFKQNDVDSSDFFI